MNMVQSTSTLAMPPSTSPTLPPTQSSKLKVHFQPSLFTVTLLMYASLPCTLTTSSISSYHSPPCQSRMITFPSFGTVKSSQPMITNASFVLPMTLPSPTYCPSLFTLQQPSFCHVSSGYVFLQLTDCAILNARDSPCTSTQDPLIHPQKLLFGQLTSP